MPDYALYDPEREQPFIVCGSKEKAGELLEKYPHCTISEVEYKDQQWVRKNN